MLPYQAAELRSHLSDVAYYNRLCIICQALFLIFFKKIFKTYFYLFGGVFPLQKSQYLQGF